MWQATARASIPGIGERVERFLAAVVGRLGHEEVE
jgi:hypothetical protein